MASNKRTIMGITVMTVIFLVFSIFLTYSMFNGLNVNHESKFNDSYTTIIKDELGITLEGKTTKDHVKELKNQGIDALIVDKKVDYYYKPNFDFIINDEGIVIKNAKTADFYTYEGLKVGKTITKIDDTVLKDLENYQDVLKLIYSEEAVKKTFTFSDNTTLEYQYTSPEVKRIEPVIENGILKIKLGNLDRVSIYSLVKMIRKETSVSKIEFDFTYASLSTLDSLIDFLSLFTNEDTLLFEGSDIKSKPGIKLDKAVTIVADNNFDQGVLFFLKALKGLNKDVTLKCNQELPNTFNALKTFEDYNYLVYLYSEKLVAKRTIAGGDLV